MNQVNLASDPYGAEESALAKKRQLAELIMSQSMNNQPIYSNKAGIAKALMMVLGQHQAGEADKGRIALEQRKEGERQAEMGKVVEFMNQAPTQGPGAPQVDDQGNPMPGNMAATAAKRAELAKALAMSRNPQIAQFGLAQMQPKEEEAFTLAEGAQRFKGGNLVASNAKTEKPNTPKAGEVRRFHQGGEEIAQEWTGTEWKELGRGARFAPQQPDRSLVEIQDPKDPRKTVLVPRDQAAGKAGAGSVTSERQSREDADGLRKEFNTLPAVKTYNDVKPIVESARKAPDTPQGDFALIYGVGKVLDPNSVVREGEMNMVIASGSPAQRVQGYLAQLQGKGRLTPSMRKELVGILDQRTAEYEKQYQGVRSTYEGIAKQRGYDSSQIFPQSPYTGGAPAKPASEAEYRALPAGARYVDPQGRERIKG